MDSQLKLPGNFSRTLWIIIPIGLLYLFGGILENELFGTHYVQWLWGALLIAAALYFAARLQRALLLDRILIAFAGIFVGLGAWHYELAKHADTVFSNASFRAHLILMGIYLLLLMTFFLLRRQQISALSRQLFEIAARKIHDKEAGFTHRPYPAGQADFTREEIIAFAKFMEKQQITRAMIEAKRVKLAFSTSLHMLDIADIDHASYIGFDDGGNISVQISETDYRQYKEQLTFDQLCEALGIVFKGFLKDFREGENGRIVAALKGEVSHFPRYLIGALLILGLVMFLFFAFTYLLVG